ncbi:hypothetical protein [Paracoccus haematequi]|uniref:hypothetical protein n=1 Tax=Paracoccus haematequi TaxID=2491866 RepID=UPI000F7DCBDF|nr:hypothetical protein [Paracoccus haematequi]
MREHVIHTPTGARILTEIGMGFAGIRQPFSPGIMSDPTTRLNIGFPASPKAIVQSLDGVFISPRHLWAILVGLAKVDRPINLDNASESLFWTKPDLHEYLMKLFIKFDAVDPYWATMSKTGYYDPNMRLVHRNVAS